jgi:putative endonuclease
MTPSETAYAYIIECRDGSLYTGWTVDLDARILAHNEGNGARYTRGRGPVRLVASWRFSNRKDAMRLEYRLKRLRREEKVRLIERQRSISGSESGLGSMSER